MALYRTLMAITVASTGRLIPPFVTSRLEGISPGGIAMLLERDAITPVSGPPFDALPDWKTRAAPLARAGITSPLELIDASPATLARTLRIKRTTIEQWQAEARALILPEGEPLDEG